MIFMFRKIIPALAIGCLAFLFSCEQDELLNYSPKESVTGLPSNGAGRITGNGAPSGSHFNLNIIGMPKNKSASMDNSEGRRIFTQLWGGDDAATLNDQLVKDISRLNKIFLQPATTKHTFKVVDANATDANGALFQLPPNVSSTWNVYARALGKPGGKSSTTTCAAVPGADGILGTKDDEVLCSLRTLTMMSTAGQSTFKDVSGELLFIQMVVDPVIDPALASCLKVTERRTMTLPIFHGCLAGYFWNYDNNGLKLLQLRFYPAQ
jgi:hypothetical protein